MSESIENKGLELSNLESKEKFEPQILIDFIRHGQTKYGKRLKEKLDEIGFDYEEQLPTSNITEEDLGDSEDMEGVVTEDGERGLREAVKDLLESIDKEKEVLLILSGPRSRHEQSREIIEDELSNAGVSIINSRQHEGLSETKEHWISIVDFIINKLGKDGSEVWNHWFNMTEDELKGAGLEGVDDIKNRMNHFTELIKRYGNRYREELGLSEKTLRVLAVTSDINISSIKSDDMDEIKNAQIVELGIDKDGQYKFL